MKRLLVFLACCFTAAADPTPMPDFSVPDINAGSDRRQVTTENVSPRNYMGQVSAYYFGFES